MGVPTSEVGYTSAMPRREDHEVRKGHVGHWIKKIKKNCWINIKNAKFRVWRCGTTTIEVVRRQKVNRILRYLIWALIMKQVLQFDLRLQGSDSSLSFIAEAWLNNTFLGAFAKLRKADCSVRRVCLHWTTWLPMEGFSWNFVFGDFSKILLNSDKNNLNCTWRRVCICDSISRSIWRS